MSKIIGGLSVATSPTYIIDTDLMPIQRDGYTYSSYINYGTTANCTLRLDSSGSMPAVDGNTLQVSNPTTDTTTSLQVALDDIYYGDSIPWAIAEGGTSAITQQGAIDNLAGAVTSGYYLRGSGTHVVMSAIQAGDVPTLNQNTTGSAAKWTTARSLGGNSVDGSASVPFANSFIVKGTSDAGLSGAQFLGALATGIVKNTTSTGDLSIAAAGDFPTLNQNTTGSSAKWTTPRTLAGNSVDGSANVPFTNSFIAKGTSDSGLTNAQFLGNLATGIVKNTTTTGNLTIAVAADFPTLNQDTTGNATTATTAATATNISGGLVNQLLYQSGAGATAKLATVNNAYLTTTAGGVPTWSTSVPTTQTAGTFIPIDSSGAGSTFSSTYGYSIRVGNLVFFTLQVVFPVTASGAQVTIGGLPHTSSATEQSVVNVFNNSATACVGVTTTSSTTIKLYSAASGSTVINSTLSTKQLIISGCYNAI